MPSCRKATTRISGSPTEGSRHRCVLPGALCHPLGRCTTPVGFARGARSTTAFALVACGAVAVGGLLSASRAVSDETTKPDRVATFMRAKLAHSQNVLEGLSVGDFSLIAKGAHDLSLASQDSNWQVLQTEDYVRQSAEFRRSCDTLRAAADAENLDAALVAWMDVTMKCVRCHRSMRDAD